jgi:hypothetical protein
MSGVQKRDNGNFSGNGGYAMTEKNAVDRAYELMLLPMRDAPLMARMYLNDLTKRVGICGEVCMTAYATYAQLTEKLPCTDDLYIPSPTEVTIYNDLAEKYSLE